ncbi:hypothetical protein F5Y13DRAFT_172829 [Hypoxylon sp. FL1857]|nr:hypothetical protein F5Y13DRAFT_172829 [Hypoxylon sp. FL1857]
MQSPTLLTLLHEPPANPESLGTDISTFLQQFWEPMANGNGPYVHPRAISFHSDQDRTNWIGYMPDTLARDLFSNFGGSDPKYQKNTLIGLFSTPNGRLVGNQWEDRGWHVYVVAIIRDVMDDKCGKRILIWDCDPVSHASEDKRWTVVLWGKQRSFVDYLRNKRHMKKAEIWYNVDTTNSGRDQCLLLSLRKVWEWASLGDVKYLGADDPRFQNCVKLKP